MRNTLILAAIAAVAFSSIAEAKACKDAKGHFTKCPAAATAMPAPSKPMTPAGGGTLFNRGKTKTAPVSAPAAMTSASASGAPHCKTGKPCGKSCISQNKVCHKG